MNPAPKPALLVVDPVSDASATVTLASKENAGDLNELRTLIEDGRLAVAVDRSFPMSETAAAIRYLMDGNARGKLVIAV